MNEALQGKCPDKSIYHKPEIINNNRQTVALILASKGIIPPREWNHNKQFYDCDNYTVEMYLKDYKLPIPNNWINEKDKQMNKPWFQQAIYNEEITCKDVDPSEQNSDGFTIAMIQAINGRIPEDRFKHDKQLKNNYGQTVEDIMIINNIEVPDYWRYKTVKQQEKKEQNEEQQKQKENKIEEQFEEEQQEQETIQDQQEYNQGNQSNIQQLNKSVFNNSDNINKTIQLNGEIQEQYFNPNRDQNGQTMAMKLADQGIIPPKQYYHKPDIKDNDGNTVAMLLASNGICPTTEWQHNKHLYNNKRQTIQQILEYNKITVPEQWKWYNENKKTIAMKQAEKGQIPSRQYEHMPEFQDDQGNTISMYLAQKHIVPPKQWEHKSELKNNNGKTVAMMLASNGIVPPQQWIHDKYIKDNDGRTVQHYLEENDIQVSKEWSLYIEGHENEPNYQNENGQTSAMILAQKCIVPSKKMQHDVELRDNYEHTACYYLWDNGVMVPDNWQDNQYKNPQYFDFNYKGSNYCEITDAMKDAIQGRIPDKKYYHNPTIKSKYGKTVAIWLAYNGIIPPKQWHHDSHIDDNCCNNVEKLLRQNNVQVPDEWKTY